MMVDKRTAGVIVMIGATALLGACGDRSSDGANAAVPAPVVASDGAGAGAAAGAVATQTVTAPRQQTTVRTQSGGAASTALPITDRQVTRIVTESGKTTCNIRAQFVECQSAEFMATYRTGEGQPATGFRYTAGAVEWFAGNMSVAVPATTVRYGRSYTALGWTVKSTPDETVFDRGGHGVRVSFTHTVGF